MENDNFDLQEFEPKTDVQSRKWMVTINNPDKWGYDHQKLRETLNNMRGLAYWCMCDEIGNKTHTYHIHLALYRTSASRWSTLCRKLPHTVIIPMRGTVSQARDYIRKEGRYKDSHKSETNLPDTFEESGLCPVETQGARNDLAALYDMIKDGKTNYQILEENPFYLDKLDKIDATREILKEEKFKNMLRDVSVEYWQGDPGTGKTSGVYALYPNYSDVYRIFDPKNPWDTYSGQDVVVFDDFHSGMFVLPLMLNWITGYPATLRSRYRQKTACFTKVYILSNVPLEQQYAGYQRDDPVTWQAFLRRIHKVRVFGTGGVVTDYNSVDDYLHHRLDSEIQDTNRFFSRISHPLQQSFRMDVDEDGFVKLSGEDLDYIDDMFGGVK